MIDPARPWILAALALPLLACGGATTSTPPAPQPLETDGGDADTLSDASAATQDGQIGEDDGGELMDAASDAEELSCPGWIEPDETASCSQNSMNNQCSANCRSGTRFWQSQCQDGSCTCSLGGAAKCSCDMEPGVCKSCCPGMVR